MFIDILLQNGVVQKIQYKDKLENIIEIDFSKQNYQDIQNINIFRPNIPVHYDIIR
jgi:uncharacterized lipoprotein YehR (DUF1307 family)